ncbi:MAG TPA: hypothetical protein VM844_04710 [Miltoncostaeaceae bacterium]|nr:hypothetical protein [Miltoncostaeaceae bacterium]
MPPRVVPARTGTWEIAGLRRAMALAREIREAPEETEEDAA